MLMRWLLMFCRCCSSAHSPCRYRSSSSSIRSCSWRAASDTSMESAWLPSRPRARERLHRMATLHRANLLRLARRARSRWRTDVAVAGLYIMARSRLPFEASWKCSAAAAKSSVRHATYPRLLRRKTRRRPTFHGVRWAGTPSSMETAISYDSRASRCDRSFWWRRPMLNRVKAARELAFWTSEEAVLAAAPVPVEPPEEDRRFFMIPPGRGDCWCWC
mmetsp:Transcript_20457/g.48315  ORF Transcript_20457/g.48315 Transcript_20457/m.48315 type:complete len:218 (-) Transcript_20457:293-946(-)